MRDRLAGADLTLLAGAAETITRERLCPVLILTACNEPQAVSRAADAGVMVFLSKPYHERDLVAGLEVAKARFDQMIALEQEVGKLEDTLKTRRLVDRAKALLMERHGMAEPEAFRAIQKTAMNQRRTMLQVAEAIILGACPSNAWRACSGRLPVYACPRKHVLHEGLERLPGQAPSGGDRRGEALVHTHARPAHPSVPAARSCRLPRNRPLRRSVRSREWR